MLSKSQLKTMISNHCIHNIHAIHIYTFKTKRIKQKQICYLVEFLRTYVWITYFSFTFKSAMQWLSFRSPFVFDISSHRIDLTFCLIDFTIICLRVKGALKRVIYPQIFNLSITGENLFCTVSLINTLVPNVKI